jgi:hypothetical protein
MAIAMTPIYTQTVGSGGVGTVVFNNIPQIYTDLYIIASIRSNTGSPTEPLTVQLTDGSSTYSTTSLGVSGTTPGSSKTSNNAYMSYNGYIQQGGNTATANTFSSTSLYIPSYTSSTNKAVIIDTAPENNSSAWQGGLGAGLYRTTSGITRVLFAPYTGTLIMQHSSFSLYGIKKG